MMSTHKQIGVILVITGLIHGIFSGEAVISLNTGTICWIASIVMGLTWMTRKILKKQSNWIKYHRFLTIIFLLTLVLHLVDVIVFDNKILTDILHNKQQKEYRYEYDDKYK